MYNSQYYTCEQIDERLLQGYLDDYNSQTGQSLTKAQFLTKLGSIFSKEGTIDNTLTQIGYYECDTAAGTAAKAITVANYSLFAGGSMKVKFVNKNTANNATLNINSQGAKALYYNGVRVSSTNTWDAGDVVEIYYDGTSYYANNVKGSTGDGVFDISVYNPTEGQPTPYANLAAALGPSGQNVPVQYRKGGMSIKYVDSSDNKYVQYRLMSDEWSTTESDWQGVKDNLVVGSKDVATIDCIARQFVNLQAKTVGNYFDNTSYPSTFKERWSADSGKVVIISSSSLYRVDAISVLEGIDIELSTNTSWAAVDAAYFCDDSDNIIQTIVKSGSVTNFSGKVPNGATKLCINYMIDFSCSAKGEIKQSLEENTNNNKLFAWRTDYIKTHRVLGKWINNNGVIGTDTASVISRFDPVTVEAGNIVYLNTNKNGLTYDVAYLCDDNDNIIQTIIDNRIYPIVIPDGVTKIYYNVSGNADDWFFFVDSGELVDTKFLIDDINLELDNKIKDTNSYLAYKGSSGGTIPLTVNDFKQGIVSGSGASAGTIVSSSTTISSELLFVVQETTITYSINTGYRVGFALYGIDKSYLGKAEWYQVPGSYTAAASVGYVRVEINNANGMSLSDFASAGLMLSTNMAPVLDRAFPISTGKQLLSDVDNIQTDIDNIQTLIGVIRIPTDYANTDMSKWIDNNGVIGIDTSGSIRRYNVIAIRENQEIYAEFSKHNMSFDFGLICDANDNILIKINTSGVTTTVPNGGTKLYVNNYRKDELVLNIKGGELLEGLNDVQKQIKKRIYIPIYAPSPQLPANDSADSDFNIETVTSTELHSAFDTLINSLTPPNIGERYYPKRLHRYEVSGMDASGVYPIYLYTFGINNRFAWRHSDELYAWKDGNDNIVYIDSCSPRIGDTIYSDVNRTDSGKTVSSYDSTTGTMADSSSISYMRESNANIPADMIWTVNAISVATPSTTYAVFDRQDSRYGTADYVDATHLTYSGKTYTRSECFDYNTKHKATLFIWTNEHGPSSDPIEPSVILYRMIKDLCGGCRNNAFLNYIKNYFKIVFIPCANPWGCQYPRVIGRQNANGVNINRNYDTTGWASQADTDKGSYAGDQSETQFIMNMCKRFGSDINFDIHCLGYVNPIAEGLMYLSETYIPNQEFYQNTIDIMYGMGFRFDHRGDPQGGAHGSEWMDEQGMLGGVFEMNAGAYSLSYDGNQHTAEVMEACYTEMLNCIRMYLYSFDSTIDFSTLAIH